MIVVGAFERGEQAVYDEDYETGRALLEPLTGSGRALAIRAWLASSGTGEDVDVDKACRLYRQAAELENGEAAYNLAAMYATGRFGEIDFRSALTWYRRAAALGYGGGHRKVGRMYAYGEGVAADPVEAAEWYLQAIDRGEDIVDALCDLAPDLAAAAGAGDVRARVLLGVVLAYHDGDPEAGREHLSLAADAGDPRGQRELGDLLLSEGADHGRIAVLYRSAAAAGDGVAAYRLILGETDPAARAALLHTAAAAGVAEATLGDWLVEEGLDDEAFTVYRASANAGRIGGMFALGTCYRDGIGTPVDLVASLRWFLAVFGRGNGDGLHETHDLVKAMTPEQVRNSVELAGHPIDADVLMSH